MLRRLGLTILGSSEGLRGSTAIFTTACVWNCSGRKMCISSSRNSGTTVAVLLMVASRPSSSTQLPVQAKLAGQEPHWKLWLRHWLGLTMSTRLFRLPSACSWVGHQGLNHLAGGSEHLAAGAPDSAVPQSSLRSNAVMPPYANEVWLVSGARACRGAGWAFQLAAGIYEGGSRRNNMDWVSGVRH